jgi:ribulose-phosphate 3-epimerase
MIKIAPSILSADFKTLGSEVSALAGAGADFVHIDVMDGHFVPNLTIGPMVVKSLRNCSDLPFDVHLMISQPDNYLQNFMDAGADYLAVHPETCSHLHRTLNYIRENGKSAGVALNPSTSLNQIEHVLDDLDLIVIMTVNPGFSAQKFIKSMIPKIEKARRLIDENNLKIELEVDGGVNVDTVASVANAGADIVVAGNAAFHGPSGNLNENIKLLKDAASAKAEA